MFDCVHAQHSLNHYGNERYSGRCRMPRSLFVTEKAALGWIFHFRISISGSPDYEVLCTAWPHLKNDTERSCIVIDDSVFKGSKEDWVTGKCTVIFDWCVFLTLKEYCIPRSFLSTPLKLVRRYVYYPPRKVMKLEYLNLVDTRSQMGFPLAGTLPREYHLPITTSCNIIFAIATTPCHTFE